VSDYRHETNEDRGVHPGRKHVEGGYPEHPNLRIGTPDIDDVPRTYQPAQVRDELGGSSIALPGSEGSTNPAELQREMYGSNRNRGLATLGVGRASRRNVGPDGVAANTAVQARKAVAALLELPDSPILQHFPEISQAKLTKARKALEKACEAVEAAAGVLERVYPEHRAAVDAHAKAVEAAALAGKEDPAFEAEDPAIVARTAGARLSGLVQRARQARQAFEEALSEAERAMDGPVSEGFAQTWEATAAKVVEAAAAVEKLSVAVTIAARYRAERSNGELMPAPPAIDLAAVAKVLRDQAAVVGIPVPELTDVAMDPPRGRRRWMAGQGGHAMWELAMTERRENFKVTAFTIGLPKNMPPGIAARYEDAERAEDMDPDEFWWTRGRLGGM
jgi:hypothetical protein